ncbi:MAG: DUF1848 domain-containing protein [Desulfobacteraceae bacterium]|jgi:hypothetical protein|nr:MAG: DUF1848 domain-containing protein [Desulfobacteraceae bacterium]
MTPRIVISASRRTDIPAFYMDWFMDRIEIGRFEIVNPFNGKTTVVEATPETVHTIVFWSKNFDPFLRSGYGQILAKKGFHLFFNFTVNSTSPILEPRLTPLAERLEQAAALCDAFGPGTVQWRFDPICFYTAGDGSIHNNLANFDAIADRMETLSVKRCITSFMDHYAKIRKRTAAIPGFNFIDPSLEKKIEILSHLKATSQKRGMTLFACCEKTVLEALPAGMDIAPAACIPNRYLVDLFGGHLSFQRDHGQRTGRGCGCMVSRDIGRYQDQPCFHDCLFCYANPSCDSRGTQ